MECGAKKRDGTACKARAMPNGKCRIHGGKSPKGMESGTFKTGRYSKFLPHNLLERYNASLEDTELLALRDEIALIDSRISSIVESVGKSKSSTEIWKQLRITYGAMELAHVQGDIDKARGYLNDVKSLIQRGAMEYEQWYDIATLIEQRRKLVETERKRLVDMQQMITVEQALTLVTTLMLSVKQNVTDKDAIARINNDIIRLGMGTGIRPSHRVVDTGADT